MNQTAQRLLEIPFIGKIRKNTFVRSVSVSVVATLVDYTFSFILHHAMHKGEVISTTIGSCFGAVVSFYLNRWWAFKSKSGKLGTQAIKYLIALLVSIGANSYGVYLLNTYTNLPFAIMRIIVTIIVGVFINYHMFKHFVFKVKPQA